MSHHAAKQGVLIEGLSKKAVIARFDQDHASFDGGAVPLKACDERLKLSARMAACLSDDRQQSKVTHLLPVREAESESRRERGAPLGVVGSAGRRPALPGLFAGK